VADELRQKVFIDEQGVPDDEIFDGQNARAIHLVAFEGTHAVATARIVQEGTNWRIGLVAVDRLMRGKHLGEKIMAAAIEHVKAIDEASEIVLTAQRPVQAFYEKLGFKQSGEAKIFDSGFALVPMKYQPNMSQF
ncbi:MAG: GNAT family N-acetyltransferase, partial [Defluviitaleaceae bacterium]|nr:GNAT family N-acetyltransferase [Defluviitaleaceae bacterium]